jgi:hypothetical protein
MIMNKNKNIGTRGRITYFCSALPKIIFSFDRIKQFCLLKQTLLITEPRCPKSGRGAPYTISPCSFFR